MAISSLQITADFQNLAKVRGFVEKAAADLRIDADVISQVLLAVTEAVTNIIVHGYRNRPGIIDIEVEQEADAFVVRLRDRAPLFDPTTVPPPDLSLPLEQRPIGGLGVFMMRHFVDEISHRPLPQGGNELTLVKMLADA